MLRNTIILLLLFKVVPATGQDINLTVLLEDAGPATGASAQLLSGNDGSMLDFAFVGDDGTCSFEKVKKGNYRIRLKFFGYRDSLLRLTFTGKALHPEITLRTVAYDLPGVSVIDKIIGLKLKGDTLQYNIRAYTSGTEQTLGDVISKLPGLDVDGGNVKVGDKKVEALLVEGRDLVNDQHKMLTEGLQSDLVESVELIRNYRTDRDLFEGETVTDEYAVNILLKDEDKGSWAGNVRAAVGSSRSLTTGLNLVRTSKQAGWSMFLRQNNIGNQPIERPASLLLEDLIDKNSLSIPNVTKRGALRQIDAPDVGLGIVENNDYHFAINGDAELKGGVKNKLYATGTSAQRRSVRNAERNYLASGLTESLESTESGRLPFLYLRNKTTRRSKKNFTEITLPVQWYSNRVDRSETGLFGGENFAQTSADLSTRLQFHPSLSHSVKFEGNYLLEVEQEFRYDQINDAIDLSANGPFLEFTETGLPENTFSQQTRLRSFASETSASVTKRWGRELLQYQAIGNFDQENTDNSSSLFYGSQTNQLNIRTLQHGVRGIKEFTSKVRFVGVLNQSVIQQKAALENTQHNYLLPNALVYVEYFKKHAFSIAHRQQVELPGLLRTNGYAYVENARFVRLHNLNLNALTHTASYRLSLLKKPIYGGHFYNLSVGTARVRRSYISDISFNENFVLGQWLVAPKVRRSFATAFLVLRYAKFVVRLDAQFNAEKGFASQNETLVGLTRNLLNTKLSLASVRWDNLDLKFGLRHTRTSQAINGRSLVFANSFVEAKADYKVKKWTFTLDLRQQIQSGNLARNQLTLLDLNATYAVSKKWKFYLDANNIFNLNGRQEVDVLLTEAFEETTMAQTFPGQVLVGVGYFF